MRLVIDLQGAQSASRWRGIGRYSLALAQAMARLRGEHEVLIALSDAFPGTVQGIRAAFRGILPEDNIRVWGVPGPVRAQDPDNAERRIRAEIVYESFLASLEPDFVHVSSLFEGFGDDLTVSIGATGPNIPTAITLYDLIPLHDPDKYLKPVPPLEALYNDRLRTLAQADLLLAISGFSAQDARAQLGEGGPSIVNVSAACSDFFYPIAKTDPSLAPRLAEMGVPGKFVLTSGTIDSNKNLEMLFEAFANLPSEVLETHSLVVPGKGFGDHLRRFHQMAQRAGLPVKKLVFTGHVSDEDLRALYCAAELMVFPSLDEGFGLPPLEAMTCGTATIASNATSLPEVIGLAEAQFDPKDPKACRDLMAKALTDGAFRAGLEDHAIKQSAKFSWEASARAAWEALEEAQHSTGRAARPQEAASLGLPACVQALKSAPEATGSDLDTLADTLAFTFHPANRAKTLFVDVSEIIQSDAHTGCQRVVRAVLRQWLSGRPSDLRIEPVYARPDRPGYVYAKDFKATYTGITETGDGQPIDYASGDSFLGLDLTPVVVANQKPFFDRMHQRGVSIRFVIYDLLPVTMPDYFDPPLVDAFKAWLGVIAGYDGIIGISQASVDAFRDWQQQNGQEIDPKTFSLAVAHLGADIDSSVPTQGLPDGAEQTLSKIKDRPSFLMVGTIEPRKGHQQVLAAFEQLWQRGVDANLVLVGKQGWKIDALAQQLRSHPEQGKRLFWLDGVSDEYLSKVYDASDCLVAASLGEGFGLPLIEAAQKGIPILARDIAVFREVAGQSARYFLGEDPESLANAVESWLRDAKADGGVPQSTDLAWLTWADSAARFMDGLQPKDAAPPDPQSGLRTTVISGFKPAQLRIVLLKLDHMGDLLLALPAISRLRARYPGAQLDLIAGSWNRSTAEQLGLFTNIYDFNFYRRKSSEKPVTQSGELETLVADVGPCDIAIDLRRQPDTRFVLTALRAKQKVGYETGDVTVDPGLTIALQHFTDIPYETTPLNETSISDQMMALVDALPAGRSDFVTIPRLAGIPQVPQGPQIALFPRAGNAIKEWGDANYLALAQALAAKSGVEAVNAYFAKPEEAQDAGFGSAGKLQVHAGLPFVELATSLAGNRLCVANNSLGVHIAAYLGVRTIGVYGGHETVAEWAPVFGDHEVIHRLVPCSPCHLPSPEDCAFAMRCLDIPVDYVAQRVLAAFEQATG